MQHLALMDLLNLPGRGLKVDVGENALSGKTSQGMCCSLMLGSFDLYPLKLCEGGACTWIFIPRLGRVLLWPCWIRVQPEVSLRSSPFQP